MKDFFLELYRDNKDIFSIALLIGLVILVSFV